MDIGKSPHLSTSAIDNFTAEYASSLGHGGSRENHGRLVLDTTDLVRAASPGDMPLFVRISGKDQLDNMRDEFLES